VTWVVGNDDLVGYPPTCGYRASSNPCSGALDADDRLAHHHRLEAVRAHLLEQAGETHAARVAYTTAAALTASVPEQHYLTLRAARLHQDKSDPLQR
jgi:predicted RNA polymerase sigma factor